MGPTYRPPSRSARIVSSKKGTWHPGEFRDSDANVATHLSRYRLHRCNILKRSVVNMCGDDIIPCTSIWISSSISMRQKELRDGGQVPLPTNKRYDAKKANVLRPQSASSVNGMAARRNLAAVRRESANAQRPSSC